MRGFFRSRSHRLNLSTMQRRILTLGLLIGLAAHGQARLLLQNGTTLDGGYTGVEAVSIISDNVLPWDGGVSYCNTNVVWLTSGSVQMNSLVLWQLPGIPPGSTITGAHVQVS